MGKLTTAESEKNKRAALFISCYLDEHNAALINSSNATCFISSWNAIEKWHRPRSATLLTDNLRQLKAINHRAGQSVEEHLIKLEAQFARMSEIKKTLSEDHQVAIILASVSELLGHAIRSIV